MLRDFALLVLGHFIEFPLELNETVLSLKFQFVLLLNLVRNGIFRLDSLPSLYHQNGSSDLLHFGCLLCRVLDLNGFDFVQIRQELRRDL